MVTNSKALRLERDYSGEGEQHIRKTERGPNKNKALTVKE
jgi:hypothetical protein